MAGKKLSLRSAVRASSILEVIVSMVVIMVVFVIALAIFHNVLRSSLPFKKLKAQTVLQNIESKKLPVGQITIVDGLRVSRSTVPYEAYPDLTVLTLTAFDENNEKIAELQKVVATKE